MLPGKLNTIRVTILSLLVVAPLQSGAADATKQSSGPTNAHPRNALQVTFVDRLHKLRETGQRLDGQIATALASMDTVVEVGSTSIEETYGYIWELRQIAKTLSAFGEPAGRDMELRHDTFRTAIMEQAVKAAQRRAVQQEILRGEKKLDGAFATANRKMDAVRKLAAKKEYARAMDVFFTIAGPLEKQAIWWEVRNQRRHPSLVAWDTMVSQWSAILVRQWADEGKLACRIAIEGMNLDFGGLFARMQTAASAVAETGNANIEDGNSVSGPELLERFGREWIQVQSSVFQARSYIAISRFLGDTTNVSEIENAYDQFMTQAGPALAGIIRADASRAGPEEAALLYFSYLDKLPEVLSRCTGGEVSSLVSQALDGLANKSPTLQQDIAAYRDCTDDLLRWRRRTAESNLPSHRDDFPSLESVITSAPNSYGKIFLTDTQRPGLMAKFRTPVPATLGSLEADFLSKQVHVGDLLFTSPIRHAATRIQRRTVAFVPVQPSDLEAAAKNLASDLFAVEGAPAPSLRAQMALHGARNNDLLDVGGTIESIGVTGWFSRFTDLSPSDRGMVRLAPLDREPDGIRTDDIVVMFVVRPAWVRSEYFFVALPQNKRD